MGEVERRFALVRERRGALRDGLWERGLFADEVGVAAADGVSFDFRSETAARHGGEVFRLGTLAAAKGKAV